jgi:transcriptional regulator with XRE-family HTH domain
MSLYNRLSRKREGARALSTARLQYDVLRLLHTALSRAGITQVELAKRLGIRKSAVNQVFRGDGNVRVSTLAEYLHAMGAELELRLVPAGKPREDAVREMHEARVSSMARAAKRLPRTSRSATPIIEPVRIGTDMTFGLRPTISGLPRQRSGHAGSTIEVVKR